MTSYSVASALIGTLPANFVLQDENSSDSYDVMIKFSSAKNLPRMDTVGLGDPYFIAKIDQYISFTSTIAPNTSSPVWENEQWIVRNIPRRAQLTVKLYDKDDEKPADDYIGRFIVPSLVNYESPPKGHKIVGAFGQYNGRFHLSIQCMPSSDETKRLPRYTFDGPCRYFRHDSFAIGRLTMLNADCVYSTWKIPMRRISVFFPPYQRQHWNTQYKAAQTIFGKCPISIATKTTIKLTHKVLYGRTVKHSENGPLNSADDLWRHVFADKTSKRIKPCIYTYVIDDNTWRFSETGVQFFADFASKHALLANGSEYVRYAGEFHIRPKHGWDRWEDEWEVVIDNGSGTYAPSKDLLANLKEMLLFNFPGLSVVTYDFKDPKLKESVEQLRIAMAECMSITPAIDQLVNHCRPATSNLYNCELSL